MAIEDIGYLIFAQFLGMTQYPGSPFTGNLFRDLIMFLIVPTIFIILVIYSMTGRIVADSKLRLMLGLGTYLFILASGYYSAFALLSGPYFIFLIFIMGLVYFFVGHFTGRAPRPAGGGGPYRESGGGYVEGGSKMRKLLGAEVLNPADRELLERELAMVNKRLSKVEENIGRALEKGRDIEQMTALQDGLIAERQQIMSKLGKKINR